MENPLLFSLSVIAILSTPGPTNMLLVTASALRGARSSIILILAEALGYITSILALEILLGPLFSRLPYIGDGFRLCLSAYLLVLAWGLWRRGHQSQPLHRVVTPVQVFVTTVLNPKALVFAFTIFPFGHRPIWPYLLGFLVLLVFVSTAWVVGGEALGRLTRNHGMGKIMPRVSAVALATFGALIATSALSWSSIPGQ
jgi:threonine/homoserine/homoserine lactone efflux protein